MTKIKNKDLKNPDKYTLGKKHKFPLIKFIAKNLFIILIICIAATIILLNIIKHNLTPFLSIPIIMFLIYSEIDQFKNYYDKKYHDSNIKFKSADKTSLYSDGIKSKLSNHSAGILSDKFFIAETNIHKLVQVIRGKSCYYIHYLKIDNNGTGFIQNSLITDFNSIDTCKKYNPKDYRINFTSIKNIQYSEKSVENTVLENNGTIMIKPVPKSKLKSKFFYPVTHISDDYIHRFFSDIKNISCFSENSKHKISYKEALQKFDRKRFAYIIMKNLYYISTVLAFLIPSYTVQSIFSIANIIIPAAILIFYGFNNNEYTINDYKNSDRNNDDFSTHPNIAKAILLPLFINIFSIFFINIITFSKFLIISLICSAIMTIILVIISADKKAVISAILISMTLSFTSVAEINYRFDFKEPAIYNSIIYKKHYTSGAKGGNTYYIQIKRQNYDSTDIRVSASEYRKCNKGDMVSVYEYKGFLDIPYIEVKF